MDLDHSEGDGQENCVRVEENTQHERRVNAAAFECRQAGVSGARAQLAMKRR